MIYLLQCLVGCEGHNFILWAILRVTCPMQVNSSYDLWFDLWAVTNIRLQDVDLKVISQHYPYPYTSVPIILVSQGQIREKPEDDRFCWLILWFTFDLPGHKQCAPGSWNLRLSSVTIIMKKKSVTLQIQLYFT